jgi:hypothetical protein
MPSYPRSPSAHHVAMFVVGVERRRAPRAHRVTVISISTATTIASRRTASVGAYEPTAKRTVSTGQAAGSAHRERQATPAGVWRQEGHSAGRTAHRQRQATGPPDRPRRATDGHAPRSVEPSSAAPANRALSAGASNAAPPLVMFVVSHPSNRHKSRLGRVRAAGLPHVGMAPSWRVGGDALPRTFPPVGSYW